MAKCQMGNRQATSNTISQNMNLLHDYSSWPISKCLFRSMITNRIDRSSQKKKKEKKRKKERKEPPSSFLKREKIGRNYRCKIDIEAGKEARKGGGREKKAREIALRLDRRRKKFLGEFLLWISRNLRAFLKSETSSSPPLLFFFRLNSPSLKTNEITISSTSLLPSPLPNSSVIISAPRRSNFHGR